MTRLKAGFTSTRGRRVRGDQRQFGQIARGGGGLAGVEVSGPVWAGRGKPNAGCKDAGEI